MTGVTTRAAKGAPLSATEHDDNLETIITLHKSATEPSPTYACMLWADTSTTLLKMRDSSDSSWITLGDLDTAGAFASSNSMEDIVDDTTPQLGGDLDTNGNDISFGDSDKAIFGAGSDLQIYHDGSNSLIQDAGTGDLILKSNGAATVTKTNAGSNLIAARDSGSVGLFHNGSEKLTTTSTGIDVTGTVTADGVVLTSGAPYINLTDTDTGVDHTISGSSAVGTVFFDVDKNSEGSNPQFTLRGQLKNRLNVDCDSGDISFYEDTGTNAKFFWDASAESLGIGTSSPSASLHLSGASQTIKLETTNDSSTFLNVRANSGAGGSFYIGQDSSAGSSFGKGAYAGVVWQSGAYPIVLATNNTERMRIDSSGNLLVGTTSLPYTAKVNIETTANTQVPLLINDSSNTATSTHRIRFDTGDTEVGKITCTSTSTTYATSSDYRLKTDVQPMTGATERLKALKPVNFEWISSGERVDGFLAHEAAEVVPEAVTGTKDAVQVWAEGEELPEGVAVGDNKLDDDGNTIPDYQGIDQSKLVPLLVATVQEQQAVIESLTARIEALEA